MDITALLTFSVEQGASDLLLSLPPMIRSMGYPAGQCAAQAHAEVQALVNDIMNDRQREDLEEHLETDFCFEVQGQRFGVNALPAPRAGAVFRAIPPKCCRWKRGYGSGIPGHLDAAQSLVLCGPGLRQINTLAAMIDFVNTNRYDHILTIEDPISLYTRASGAR